MKNMPVFEGWIILKEDIDGKEGEVIIRHRCNKEFSFCGSDPGERAMKVIKHHNKKCGKEESAKEGVNDSLL